MSGRQNRVHYCAMETHTIAVIGATGGIGRHVVRQSLASGHRVHALARTPDNLAIDDPALTKTRVDVRDLGDLTQALAGASHVLSCLGRGTRRGDSLVIVGEGTRNIVAAMATCNIRRLALISSIGVSDSHGQLFRIGWAGWLSWLAFATLLRSVKRDLNDAEAVATASDLDYVIVRSAGLSNSPGTGTWRTADARGTVGNAIAREDVARFMVSLVSDRQFDRTAVSLGS